MAKKAKKKKDEQESGVQGDLIDVAPENAKPIIRAARLYKKFLRARQEALSQEIKQKAKVLELVRAAELQPIDNTGKLRFEYDGVTISITPRDELVQIKDKAEMDKLMTAEQYEKLISEKKE